MRYCIGLDIGIDSVGYSVLELDNNDLPMRIIRFGSRIFDRAEQPKTGASLAAPRREARGARRTTRRHRHRMERIRSLLTSSGVLSKEKLEHLYDGKLSDVYELRTKALDSSITNEEFARVLIHIAQRRGFKSNRKAADVQDGENGKLLAAINENNLLCKEKGYRTVGEMLFLDEKFADCKRNKADSYLNTIDRASVEHEVHLIFQSQRLFGNALATKEFEDKYLSILLAQRSFAEGPGAGPYSGNQIEKMRGKCTFEKEELRVPKASYSFQVFNLWQHINHIRYTENGETKSLTDAQRKTLFEEAHRHETITFAQVRSFVGLTDDSIRFSGVNYFSNDYKEAEKKKKIDDLKVYHEVRKLLKKRGLDVKNLSWSQLDCIGEAFSKNKSDDDIGKELEKGSISQEYIESLLALPNYAKFGHLSIKACLKIIPGLETGLTYDKACEAAGYVFNKEETQLSKYLPPLASDETAITNPVVKRSISQTIKVVNAIIREQGDSPVFVNIELARELPKNFSDRRVISKKQEERSEENKQLLEQLKDTFPQQFSALNAPGGQDLLKYRLWCIQDGRCPYSQEPIALERLFEPGYTEIDHIIPYSVSFDDRLSNKVLVLGKENQLKGNRLPLQYMSDKQKDSFTVWVNSQHCYSGAKKRALLMENMPKEEGWKNRNIQDTQYISSFLMDYISSRLEFAPFKTTKKRHVNSINGAITSYVRKRWGITKIRENGDGHHAVDATIVGCITPGMVQTISQYSKYHELKNNPLLSVDKVTGEVVDRFPQPWKHYKEEIEIRLMQEKNGMVQFLEDLHLPSYEGVILETLPAFFVSRMCNHKVTGPAHLQTVRSGREISNGKVISKVPLNKLKWKNGEIENYYNPDSDRLLYEALCQKLEEYHGNAELAFASPFNKPKADGSKGPVVKSVKIIENASLAVPVQQGTGVADNDTMVRVDVFYIENDGYYFVPLYVADSVKAKLPSLAPTCKKDADGKKVWKQMEEANFCFSLRKNDLIIVYDDKKVEMIKKQKNSTLPLKQSFDAQNGIAMYFSSLDISTATITCFINDNTYEKRGLGKTILAYKKCEVDVLGNIRFIEKEKRQTFDVKK